VIRGEGVGRTVDDRRVYFGELSVAPFGAWAERTLVPAEEVWEVPDDVDDVLAITMGIAGTGALPPLEQVRIQPGETVLIFGATGTLGHIALQLAGVLGGPAGWWARSAMPQRFSGCSIAALPMRWCPWVMAVTTRPPGNPQRGLATTSCSTVCVALRSSRR
jgi:hypothetical protein